ncbi:cobyric acid synthase [Synechococcus sp. CS-602]|uniref:cobyric acid synthase n=1 Tax=Synechococcaceae TaxID=1890426 RepID=UPI0009F94FFC|nr:MULTISPECIES: cobyric acid synthase [Synechococcaceae]MCT0203902.1 cobyric acid synthase [Synechococcus sp. CS-602]MCT0245508.1 cobyric acid synthase [Synechococcus sp. CS-601]MCT4364119.1 cobyric acid synthase [Candidatus Regnicoccus frigidus MAG-AL1]MCT4367272.1 cobyric acid synthase [Candidatus Regnicoccus frigidus MAG-AL2]
MVLGTSSGAGKSLMTAALCRVLRRRGEQPLPFKGQNMSLNAWVDRDGGEMAYSQALQAWAAGLEPEVAMNPVLLKPQGDSRSELIHLGQSVGVAQAEHYYRDWFRPGWQAIRQGLASLQDSHPGGRLVLEGAGSPVEVNLQHRDLTNLRLAQFLGARCLLVADIERGGVFAQIIGTLALLRPVERPLIGGILINRFRGRRSLFDEGRRWLERETGIPVLGVMPWLDELFPPEDSLDLLERRARKPDAELEIAVIRLPSISNFSDFDPLEAEPSVRLRWLRPGEALGRPDAVLIPGSKQTLRDLAALKASPMAAELERFVAGGGHLFGLCGGLQMLGKALEDPEGLEGGGGAGGGGGTVAGLGYLPLLTRFGAAKALRQCQAQALWPAPADLELAGFELHRGLSQVLEPEMENGLEQGHGCRPLASAADLGWWQPSAGGGVVAGTYLHGVFESGPWRRRWLNQLRRQRDLPALSEDQPHHSCQREALLDRLADAFEAHVNLEPLLALPRRQTDLPPRMALPLGSPLLP